MNISTLPEKSEVDVGAICLSTMETKLAKNIIITLGTLTSPYDHQAGVALKVEIAAVNNVDDLPAINFHS